MTTDARAKLTNEVFAGLGEYDRLVREEGSLRRFPNLAADLAAGLRELGAVDGRYVVRGQFAYGVGGLNEILRHEVFFLA